MNDQRCASFLFLFSISSVGDDDSESNVDDLEVSFQLKLPPVLDCLSMFGQSSSSHPVLCLKYETGQNLQMWMEESGVVIEVRLQTRPSEEEGEGETDPTFANTSVKAKVIMLSEYMKDVLR